jgi:hypothetical protein
MRNLRNSLKIRNIIPRVPNSLYINRLGAVINSSRNIRRIIPIDKLSRNTQPRKHNLKLVISTPVQVTRRNDVITSVRERRDSHELGRLARGRGDGGDSAL